MDSNEEHTATLLCHTKIICHQHLHFHFVAKPSVVGELTFKKPAIGCSDHPANIFHKEELGLNLPERPQEFPVKKIVVIIFEIAPFLHVRRAPFRSFTKTGAGITADKDVCLWKFLDVADVTFMKIHIRE